jgi:hypothetical protein
MNLLLLRVKHKNMKIKVKKQSIQDLALVLLAGILLCYMGFYNRFPLVFPDCGTYIGSGCDLYIPLDRPIFYGLFVRHISLLTSLWLVIWAQGTLLALILFYYFKYLSGTARFRFYYVLYVTLITFFTAASFNVSQLIPDIFTPISILSLGLLLFAGNMKKRDIVMTSIIFVYSIAVHNSHLFINILLLLIFTIIYLFRKFRQQLTVFSLSLKRILFTWVMIIFSWLMVCTVNASLGAGFRNSGSGHVFMMSRLLNMGILELYLKENCLSHHYKICEYKDKMPWDFIWDWRNSPLYKFGDGWKSQEVKDEYNAIIRDILTTPRYCNIFIVKSIESTAKQFFCFSAGDGPYLDDKDNPAYTAIAGHYKVSLKEFLVSRQHGRELDLKMTETLQKYLLAISLFFCIAFLLFPRLAGKYKWIILFIILGMLMNAFICGTLSDVVERYQTRVVWLIPLPLILIMANREFFVPTIHRLFKKNNINN